ncbi:unnamed protein product, partial [Darwinula stevensoni]
GEWRPTFFFNQDYFLSLCYTFHPNVSLGFGGQISGYELQFENPSRKEDIDTVYWEIKIHRDLGWASTYIRSSYTPVRVKPGTYNHVVLSPKEVNQLDTQTYHCDSRDGYSRDECMDTCTWMWTSILPLSCRLSSMNVSLPMCDHIGAILEMGRIINSAWNRHNELLHSTCICPPPCHRLRYAVDVRTLKQALDEYNYLWIYLPEDIVEVLVEKEVYDLIQVFGEFGGCLVGEWRSTLFINAGGDNSKNYELSLCYTLHPNAAIGFGGENSGYFLQFESPQLPQTIDRVFWEVNIHRDLEWAAMYLMSSYTPIRVKPGTHNYVILSAKDVNQLSTQTYPCESMDGYSRDKCMDTCLSEWILPQLPCRLPSMNVSLPVCDNMGEIVNHTRTYHLLSTKVSQSNLNCSCPPPCNRLRYTVEVSPPSDAFDNNGYVWIYFSEDILEVLVEKEAYDLIQAVGEFGGCLVGEWRSTLFINAGEDNSKNYELSLCYTFHPNVAIGFGGERSGYFLQFESPQWNKTIDRVFWEVNIHRDLEWAAMYLMSSYTTIRVKPGTHNYVILSAKDVNQLSTQTYPCESMDGYSRDKCMDTCLWEWISPQLPCHLSSMNVSLPVCDNMGEIVNHTRTYHLLSTKVSQSNLNCSCPPPCNRLRYTVEVSPPSDAFDNNGYVWIYFSEDILEVLVEKEAYDLIQAVGEFGGCLGMFLGISLVSLYESLDRVIRFFVAKRIGIE